MTPLARLSDEQHDGTIVVTIDGEVDASNAFEIGERLKALMTNETEMLVVDLTRTGYIDSAGLNLMFTLADELKSHRQRLSLVVSGDSPIARTLAITGVGQEVQVHPDLPSALERA
jgi:anti-anti-sigma factor